MPPARCGGHIFVCLRMNDIYYRIIDAGHGAIIVLLLVFICCLLLRRQTGIVRVRYLAGLFLTVSCLQTGLLFLLEEELRLSLPMSEHMSLWSDLAAGIAGIGMVWVLFRNRHLYGRRLVYVVGALLLLQ